MFHVEMRDMRACGGSPKPAVARARVAIKKDCDDNGKLEDTYYNMFPVIAD